MGASLYWEPVKRKRNYLSEGAPSSFMESMERAFGSRTPLLNQGSKPLLKGMAAADPGRSKTYTELLDALEEYDEIEISAEY